MILISDCDDIIIKLPWAHCQVIVAWKSFLMSHDRAYCCLYCGLGCSVRKMTILRCSASQFSSSKCEKILFECALHSSIMFLYRLLRYLGAISSILKKLSCLGSFHLRPRDSGPVKTKEPNSHLLSAEWLLKIHSWLRSATLWLPFSLP